MAERKLDAADQWLLENGHDVVADVASEEVLVGDATDLDPTAAADRAAHVARTAIGDAIYDERA